MHFQVQLSFCFALYMKGGEKVESISQISSLVKEYIMPETVWLVPCLYALGSIIKRSIRIDDTLIPTVLCVVGIFFICPGVGSILRADKLDAVDNSGSGQHRTGVCSGSGCGLPQSAYQAAQNLRQVEKRI